MRPCKQNPKPVEYGFHHVCARVSSIWPPRNNKRNQKRMTRKPKSFDTNSYLCLSLLLRYYPSLPAGFTTSILAPQFWYPILRSMFLL
ncbi:hypothetical protein BC937DRAFT_88527 [Endogone sp. FLAS-F59071]|nr:hypothetical protein BC937DRAFT_88527 [Endogone sp. FLAS-F59071]|eukprot:RUS18628.1 hypothetical protein BC937DRAFT_88527 [Endogone sp. FLAS-F59071]